MVVDGGHLYNPPGGVVAIDDAAVSAIHENWSSTSGPNSGVGYVFAGGSTAMSATNPARLEPYDIQRNQSVGYRGVKIGRLLLPSGSPPSNPSNLLFVGASNRTVTGTSGVGAVDGYLFCGNPGNCKLAVFSVEPPNESGTQAPAASQAFGECIGIGDFDGDGAADLAIGAPGQGRVVIVWGDPGQGQQFGLNLTNGKLNSNQKITVLTQPPVGSNSPFGTLYDCQLPRGSFGTQLDVADIDGDGLADLVVGEPNFPFDTQICPTHGTYNGKMRVGRVHIYSGTLLASLKPNGTISNPNFIHVGSQAATQTIIPPVYAPTNDLQDGGAFGFYLFLIKTTNALPELFVHGENTHWPGAPYGACTGSPVPNQQNGAGSLLMYANGSSSGAPSFSFTNATARTPKRWIFSNIPQLGARYAKWVARGTWKNTNSNAFDPAFFVGEPDHDSTAISATDVGRVHILFLSTLINSNITDGVPTSIATPDGIFENGYMDFPHSGGVSGPQAGEEFARWFAFGNFDGAGADSLGIHELIIVAHVRDVYPTQNANMVPNAGAVAVISSQ